MTGDKGGFVGILEMNLGRSVAVDSLTMSPLTDEVLDDSCKRQQEVELKFLQYV